MQRLRRHHTALALAIVVVLGIVAFSPSLLTFWACPDESYNSFNNQFPVTVEPHTQTIAPRVDVAYFLATRDQYRGRLSKRISDALAGMIIHVANASWYRAFMRHDERVIRIESGMRKEQVAESFAKALSWNVQDEQTFLAAGHGDIEGIFAPGIYEAVPSMSPATVRALVDTQFDTSILSHYSSSTEAIVPLATALTVASLIEREAAGAADRRLISGVIWNRLFLGMPLQLDATLQYAKASDDPSLGWWPPLTSSDRSRESPYNTYKTRGLPKGPIANPSISSLLAALNPEQTSCLFYFHDLSGHLYCNDTYEAHVSDLRLLYGRGR